MKSTKLLFVLFLATVTLISCNKDDDGKITEEPTIEGTWKMTGQKINGEPSPLDDCEEKMTFIFDESVLTTYSYEGEECEIEEVIVYDYTLEGRELTLTSENLTARFTVEKLTETLLELSNEIDGTVYSGIFTKQ